MNSREFIKLLDDYEINVFDAHTIEEHTGLPYSEWKHITRSLLHNGFIHILEKGKYVRHNFSDEKVIGSFVVNKGTISYWSALHFHGYTTQIPNTIFVQSSQRKTSKIILGVNYQFVHVLHSQHLGIESGGFGNNIFYNTDIEKTILDCLHKPQYGGELPELIKAIHVAPLDVHKLILYAKALNNKAIVQRLAFYLEVCKKTKMKDFLDFARDFRSKGYALLDPDGLDTGDYTTKWNLRLNISESDVSMMINE
jgi:predicted transcriptional regulator of viral defense system